MEYHSTENALPNLKVLICRGRKDVTIKVCNITAQSVVILFLYGNFMDSICGYSFLYCWLCVTLLKKSVLMHIVVRSVWKTVCIFRVD